MSASQSTLRTAVPPAMRPMRERPPRPDLDNIFSFTSTAPESPRAPAVMPEAPRPAAGSPEAPRISSAPIEAPRAPVETPRAASAQPETSRLASASAEAPRSAMPATPDLDAALDMLNRAAKAMDAMQARYQRVEDDARTVAARAERTLAETQTQARDWEARALASEAQLTAFKVRVLDAEHRAEQAERRAAAAREWLGSFYDKVMAAFEVQPFSGPAAA